MTSATAVTICSLLAGAICLGLYVAEVVVSLRARPVEPARELTRNAAVKAAAPAVDIEMVTKLIDAMSGLTNALAKAGPALTSLIGAVLFFAIAAASSGAFHGPALAAPPPPTPGRNIGG